VVHKHDYSAMKENVNSTIEANSCLEIQPTVYRDGFEWYRVLAFRQLDLPKLFRALSKNANVSVASRKVLSDDSTRDTMAISTGSIFAGVTARQLRALRSAIASGYFDSPGLVRTSDIANRLGVPRTTFETHLRKAEGKVLRSLLPYLEMKIGSESRRPIEQA